MKRNLLAAFLTIVFTISCSKEKNNLTPVLNRKWQVYSIKVLKIEDSFNQGACSYQTRVSDLYGPPTIPSCQDDDIYDFTDQNELTIYSGAKKCMFSDPTSITKHYEQRGDSLFIGGYPYHIVHLSRDTLILDYCNDINTYPPGTVILNRAKLGMKFIAVK